MPVLKDPRREKFCQLRAMGVSAHKAYPQAGFEAKTAKNNAWSMAARNPEINERIKELMEAAAERATIDAAYILTQAVKVHERCMQEIEPVLNKDGSQQTDDEGRPLYVFNAKDALKALEILGKHKQIQAFKETIDLNTSLQITISPEDAEA